jgi:hypothetical protein
MRLKRDRVDEIEWITVHGEFLSGVETLDSQSYFTKSASDLGHKTLELVTQVHFELRKLS